MNKELEAQYLDELAEKQSDLEIKYDEEFDEIDRREGYPHPKEAYRMGRRKAQDEVESLRAQLEEKNEVLNEIEDFQILTAQDLIIPMQIARAVLEKYKL